MTSRPGELRHEEFSHCCTHESLLETKLFLSSLRRQDVGKEKFRRTLFYKFSGQSLKCVWRKGENK